MKKIYPLLLAISVAGCTVVPTPHGRYINLMQRKSFKTADISYGQGTNSFRAKITGYQTDSSEAIGLLGEAIKRIPASPGAGAVSPFIIGPTE